MMEKLINAVRALRTEPQKILNQPKIVMPDVSPTINAQPADVTVPHQIVVHPAKVDMVYPEAPKKWKFNIKRQGQVITEIIAEVVK